MKLTIDEVLQEGEAAYKEGKLEKAERLYRAVLQSQPLHPDANHNLGVLAVSVNNAGKALPLFKTALEANPEVEQFWLSYIEALIKEKQFENAKRVIERAKGQGVTHENLNALKAQLAPMPQTENANRASPSQQQLNSLVECYQTGRYGDAEELAVSITEEFPKHQLGWKILSAILKQTGRISESLVSSQKSLQLEPRDPAAHYNLGNTLKALGRLDEAEGCYRQSITLKADLAEAHSNLGSTLKELGRLDEAEASCAQAIKLKPDLVEAHCNLGNALKELGRLDEAEASHRQAIKLKPDYAEAHNNLGISLKELGRLEEAKASYTQAITLKPDLAEAHNNIGITLKELGRLEEAEASYVQALALKADLAEAHSSLGITLQELGRLEEAEASYARAIALKPDYAEAHSNLGVTLQELGRLEEAEARHTQAIALRPDYAEAYSNLGVTLQKLGKLDECVEAHNKALAIQPGNAEALFNLSTAKMKSVPSWHIPMMNEHDRNEAYQKAMKSAIRRDDVVLDIGTGAGLLSMIAADCGAKEIITCEMSKTISGIAERIIQKNGFDDKIRVINKNSKDLILGQDINRRVDVLVSEILSSEFVGEGIQTTVLDAKKRLLKKTGKMIPEGGTIMIALIENTGKLAKELFVDNALGYDIGDFNPITTNKHLITLEDEPVFLSEPVEAFTFDFCNFEQIYRDKKTIKIEANKAGSCAGVIQWLKVQLYDDIEYQNNPVEMHQSKSVSGWKTPIFKFNDPVNVAKGQLLNIQATLHEDFSWFNLDRL